MNAARARQCGARCLLAALIAIGALASARAEPAESAMLSRAALAHASGAQIFRHICQGCHMPDARGARGAGSYPALAGDPNLASARFAAAIVLHGRRNMPSFAAETDLTGFEAMMHVGLDDAQIADVVNYVRSHFGNRQGDVLTAADVRALHVPKGSP